MMKFRDQDGSRKFFRMEDQVKMTNNETLKFLQTKLNTKVEEEGKFFNALQRQIKYNKEKAHMEKQGGRR